MLMLLLLLDLGTVGTQQAIGESGGEDSEDEWNYIKVDKKLDGLAAVEETSEPIVESPTTQEAGEESKENRHQQEFFSDNVSNLKFYR